jgi:hypothetical protein
MHKATMMNKNSILLVFIILTSFSSFLFSQNHDIKLNYDLIRPNYSIELSGLFNKIINEQEIEDSSLLFSCPINQDEYFILYEFTDPDTSKLIKGAYYKRKGLIREKLKEGNIEFLKRQMIMSVFIDGEEAEGFFEGLEHYYSLHPDSFCKAYENLLMTDKKEKYRRMRTLDIDCFKNE